MVKYSDKTPFQISQMKKFWHNVIFKKERLNSEETVKGARGRGGGIERISGKRIISGKKHSYKNKNNL